MKARTYRGEKAIRRHLAVVDAPIIDPSRDPEAAADPGCARGSVTFREVVTPPWADRVDELPFCPTCNAPFVDGEQTCSCDWTSELVRAAA